MTPFLNALWMHSVEMSFRLRGIGPESKAESVRKRRLSVRVVQDDLNTESSILVRWNDVQIAIRSIGLCPVGFLHHLICRLNPYHLIAVYTKRATLADI